MSGLSPHPIPLCTLYYTLLGVDCLSFERRKSPNANLGINIENAKKMSTFRLKRRFGDINKTSSSHFQKFIHSENVKVTMNFPNEVHRLRSTPHVPVRHKIASVLRLHWQSYQSFHREETLTSHWIT